jgi:radical SAM superfamily enzyme YgiQ (UPF0313 family)
MQVVILTSDSDPTRQLRYLGPYQIAWWLRKNDYSTQVIDMLYFMSTEQRLNLYKKYITSETKIVAYSPFIMLDSSQKNKKINYLIWEVLNEIKILFPTIKIVIGGVIVRDFQRFAFKNIPFKVDAIFKGEGENSFLKYCNYIFKGEDAPFYQIDTGGNKIIDSLPETFDIQKCDMKFAENDFILPNEALPLELSRGCIFKCKFCQYPNIGKNKNDFNKSMDCVRESLVSNYELFGTTKYYMTDDTFNSHRERTIQFCEMVKTLPFKIQYVGYIRMDLLAIWPEQVKILPQSGLISCHFGIESLDPYSCNMIGKGWGAKNHKKYLEYICKEWDDDVIIKCSLIAGLGKETEKEWRETDQWFIESKVHDWYFNSLDLKQYQGFSEFEKSPEKYGYKFKKSSLEILEAGILINPYIWYNDYTDRDEAMKFVNNIGKETSNQRIPSGWDLMTLLNLGYSLDEMKKTSYAQRNKNEITEKHQKNVDSYYDKAINY